MLMARKSRTTKKRRLVSPTLRGFGLRDNDDTGKKSTSVTTSTTTKTTTTTKENVSEATDTTSIEQAESKKEEPTSNVTENNASKGAPNKEFFGDEFNTFVESVEKLATYPESSQDEAIAPAVEKKKKYVGVARMRRKMLAKKRMENTEEKSNDKSESLDAMMNPGKTSEEMATDSVEKMELQPVKKKTVPIYMHIFVIFLLFSAGFDVGVQQFHVDVDVHSRVAIQEYGVPFFHRNPWQSLTKINTEKDDKRALEDNIRQQTDGEIKSFPDLHDEFLDINIEEEYIPNVDPLFGVDLDEMTKGPGFLNAMAKGAISVHRIILWLVYYVPVGILTSFLSIPSAFIQTPPSLFLSAIILRQVVGKIILGADIPKVIRDDKNDGKNHNGIEIMSLAKNFVKNFFAATFPTLVTLYDAFVHLKSDMYIVLCGLFFGLAWTQFNNNCDAPPIVGGEGSVNDNADEL